MNAVATVLAADRVELSFRPDAERRHRLAAGEPLTIRTRSLLTGGAFERSTDYADLTIPLTGPVELAGVRAGDRVLLRIHAVDIADRGAMVTLPGRGGFSRTLTTYGQVLDIDCGEIRFSDTIRVPVAPMIGKLGLAAPDSPGSSTVGDHGGNLDCKEIATGAEVVLTAQLDGGLLYLGDLHACQGDGECSLTGVEVEGAATISWTRAPQELTLANRPLVLTAGGDVLTIGDGDTLDEAVRVALDDMLTLVSRAHDWPAEKAAMLLSIAAHVGICQVVNPRRSAKVSLAARYFSGTAYAPFLTAQGVSDA